jgi:hypothetical protein
MKNRRTMMTIIIAAPKMHVMIPKMVVPAVELYAMSVAEVVFVDDMNLYLDFN